jgi:hypothetical protein
MPPEAALNRLGGGLDAEAAGVLAAQPILAVDLDAGPVPEALVVIARSLPAVFVGVARRRLQKPPPFDILLTEETTAPAPWVAVNELDTTLVALGGAVDRSAPAAVILVQLLRLSKGLTMADGLVAESLAYSTLQASAAHQRWLAAQRARRLRWPDTAGPAVSAVLVGRDGDRLTIRLNRPDVHNAYNTVMRDELTAALELAAADPAIRDIELSGVGPSFSSGGDLSEFGISEDPVLAHLIRTTRSPATWLARVADRTVAVVHGSCVGAGVELPAFAGRVVADPGATFRLPEVAMGLIPGAGGTVSLPRRIGRARTAYLAVTGQTIDADTARTWRLVDEIRSRDG